jgi:hypothetical protein
VTVHAYLLLGDPEWLGQSVRSYYDHVERIVASYDVDHRGWNGHPMRTRACLDLLADLDVDHKVEYLGGHYADPGAAKYEAETRQRQQALDAAGEGARWVLQLDADEIVPDWATFEAWLHRTEAAGLTAMWYPQRVIQAEVRPGVVLERATRRVRTDAGHPGPLALRSGSRLVHIRHDDSPRALLPLPGLRNRIPRRSWVLHYAWARSRAALHRKRYTSSHVRDIDWDTLIEQWERANRAPWRAVAGSLAGRELQPVRLAVVRGVTGDPGARFDASAESTGIAALADEAGRAS